MTSILSSGTPIDAAQQLASLLGHDDDLRRRLDDALHHRALGRGRLGQHRVQRRDDRHGEARKQLKNVAAGFAAENSEFVLQGNDVEPAGVQERGGAHIVFDGVVLDLQGDRRRDSRRFDRGRSSRRCRSPRSGREFAIARSRSVVKVAIPQRRGSELPMKAMRRSGVMFAPRPGLQIVEQREQLDRQRYPVAH